MFNLIIKEFLIQKKIIVLGFLYAFFAAFTFSKIAPNGTAVYFMAPIAIIYLLILYSSGYDEKNTADIIFKSLPLRQEEIIIAKYLTFFFFATFGLLCSIFVGYFSMTFDLFGIERAISIRDILFVLTAGMLFVSVFYPLYFKFGLNKMRIFTVFFFLAIMFIPGFLAEFSQNNSASSLLSDLISFMVNTQEWILAGLLLTGSVIIFLASLMLSVHIYKNKDF